MNKIHVSYLIRYTDPSYIHLNFGYLDELLTMQYMPLKDIQKWKIIPEDLEYLQICLQTAGCLDAEL